MNTPGFLPLSHPAPAPNAPVAFRHTGPEEDRATASGVFVQEDGETWYRIDGLEHLAPFLMVLAGDSDFWAYVSTAGSLAAGRRDAEGSFFPYETVDKIHLRGEHTGPRTWVWMGEGLGAQLWLPFAPTPNEHGARRSVWKNLASTRIRFREEHPSGRLVFQYEWFTAAGMGLVRSASLLAPRGPVPVRVLDGLLNLVPPGVSVELASRMSSLTDAYKWNELHAQGRLGLFTLYAQIWDRAEPKESFHALAAWHAGAPEGARTLLSAHQVDAFCRGDAVVSEPLTRGRRSAFLVSFDATAHETGLHWHQVVDSPLSQAQAFDLASRLGSGAGSTADIAAARARNAEGLAELLARADAFQDSASPMAAAHHQANVLFNIMRGGVFVDGQHIDRDELIAHARRRHRASGERLAGLLAHHPARLHRDDALHAARQGGAQLERLVLGYLPLTFSRRHGDPSRPWNRFTIRVRGEDGRRLVSYEGNWRDIFQNWEALLPSEPGYANSMLAVFLGAMTPDGHNPYRIGSDGIDWEVEDEADPWSHIGYWGDHQVIYLLKLLEAGQAHDPGLLQGLWNQPLFGFADVPYRLKPHAHQVAQPKSTVRFDQAAHRAAKARAAAVGADGLLVCDAQGEPVLATLGEKLATILLAKAGTLVPGGGLWLNTQRPEWNDANNALVGNGLSVVTLAHLRRFLQFLMNLPAAGEAFACSRATVAALNAYLGLVAQTPLSVVDDSIGRRSFLDSAGAVLDTWRAQAYQGAAARTVAEAPAGLLRQLAVALLPLVDASLRRCRRPDGLFDSYSLVDFFGGQAEVLPLYPMLEGQVALLSSGLLTAAEAVALLVRLFDSPLFSPRHNSFLLYPDRPLPGFLERNRLDAEALSRPLVQRLLAAKRTDLLQTQSDGCVRFAPHLANRADVEGAAADLGAEAVELADLYEQVLRHREFTGRSGTMFGYEGLGCVYWHMVAKLLLAVQECVFKAADARAPEVAALSAFYRRVRDGLGYRKSAADYGAFPADPYSHTAGEGGAQQPGMTGQVKEEILTRWGELGLRVREGLVHIDPVLLDSEELPEERPLTFTWAGVPYAYRRGSRARLRVQRAGIWQECPGMSFDPQGVTAVEAELDLAGTEHR
ncbi:MAG: hypothetical protein ACK57J_16775 [Rubrivivax sp.]